MEEKFINEIARLRAYYGAAPVAIAEKLGLAVRSVEKVFDRDGFELLVQQAGERFIEYVQRRLESVDVPVQATRNRFAAGNHDQKLSLARSIAFQYLPPRGRFPDE